MNTDAGTIKVTKGDRDCSSAVCEAWELALAGSPYDGLITRYNWTGGMREMFVGSELFSWEPMSFNASRGDIYLDEENHTAMCIRNDGTADLLGEFSISETGGIDGEPGDQTGRESWVHDYYSGSWDGILHYNGKADVGGAPGGPALVRLPATCQSLRRGSSPANSAMAMRAWRLLAPATTRSRRR